MRGVEKRAERVIIEAEMDDLGRRIIGMMASDPLNFDAREPLWMRREALRAQLETMP